MVSLSEPGRCLRRALRFHRGLCILSWEPATRASAQVTLLFTQAGLWGSVLQKGVCHRDLLELRFLLCFPPSVIVFPELHGFCRDAGAWSFSGQTWVAMRGDDGHLQGLLSGMCAFVPPLSSQPLSLLSDHWPFPLWVWEKLILQWSGISLPLCKGL